MTSRPPQSRSLSSLEGPSSAEATPSSAEAVDWYELPKVYDVLFGEGTEREADFLEAVAARHGVAVDSRLRVLEPACGSGRLVVAMARRGHHVTGFDSNASMLRYARERLEDGGFDARLFEDELASFEPERIAASRPFDLAFCLVSTFKYLATEGTARSHLSRVARTLAPGGLYVLGLHLSEYSDREPSREAWHANRDGLEVRSVLDAAPADRILRRERCTVRLEVRDVDGVPRRYRHGFGFRTYDVDQLRSLLARVPQLELVATYGFDYDLEAPVPLDGDRLDVVLVLRRGEAGGEDSKIR